MDAVAVVLVVDVANVMGSRPDGWWRDRAAAAQRILVSLAALTRRAVQLPDGDTVRVVEVVAVLEGASKAAEAPAGVRVRLAPRDGDTDVVDAAVSALQGGTAVVVVTADRGLRDRLPAGARVAGPGWLNGLLGR